jgi:hypothetical protein
MTFDAPSMTRRVLPADFYTSSYRIVGKVMIPSTGILGLINDPTNSYLEIQDARLARVHMPSKLAGHYEVIRLVKTQIFVVALARREDLGIQSTQPRGGYERLSEFPVRITSAVYELEGTLERGGRFDFSAVMMEGNRDFVPIYNATLSAILIPTLRAASPAALFNRRQVDLLALTSQLVEA